MENTIKGNINRKRKDQPKNELSITFFHIENWLSKFKIVAKKTRQLVCEKLLKKNKFAFVGDRLSEKNKQVEYFPGGRETRCLGKKPKWNKDPGIKRHPFYANQLVYQVQFHLNCQWNP